MTGHMTGISHMTGHMTAISNENALITSHIFSDILNVECEDDRSTLQSHAMMSSLRTFAQRPMNNGRMQSGKCDMSSYDK